MSSLTPITRNKEASAAAMEEGAIAGTLVLIPSASAVYLAMRSSPLFMARTNWQSRTAMAIMPALFAFAFTAENYLHHKMMSIADEEEGKHNVHQHRFVGTKNHLDATNNATSSSQQEDLMAIYKRTLDDAKVSVVPGDKLGLQHRLANYVAANPVKTLAALAVPSVGLIFYGRAGQQHLQMSLKILHTRVFGQFTAITLLLSIMGFTDYMNRNGKFITEVEAFQREEEMRQLRKHVYDRLEYEHHKKEETQQELAALHDEAVREKKQQQHQQHKQSHPQRTKRQDRPNQKVTENVPPADAAMVATSPAN